MCFFFDTQSMRIYAGAHGSYPFGLLAFQASKIIVRFAVSDLPYRSGPSWGNIGSEMAITGNRRGVFTCHCLTRLEPNNYHHS